MSFIKTGHYQSRHHLTYIKPFKNLRRPKNKCIFYRNGLLTIPIVHTTLKSLYKDVSWPALPPLLNLNG